MALIKELILGYEGLIKYNGIGYHSVKDLISLINSEIDNYI